MTSSLGAESDPYLKPHEWLVTVSYRSLHSFRDFQGSKELPVPSPPELYANTHVKTFDLGVTYAMTRRLSLTLDLPIQYGSRETYIEHDGISRHTMYADGVGDVRLMGSFWLLDSEKHRNENVSLGLGLKIPTGNSRATDYSYQATGRILRPVDPAIQLGDGGWGILLASQAFKKVAKNTFVYFQGIYLVNPREMNGTESPFGNNPAITGGDIGYIIDSVPDQYLGRIGLTHTIWPAKKLSVSLGARIDGVPSHDLIGGSDGYRLPGYSIAIEPGFSWSRGKNFLALTVPVAVKRHASKSVADVRTNSPFAGIATLADLMVTVSYSRRF